MFSGSNLFVSALHVYYSNGTVTVISEWKKKLNGTRASTEVIQSWVRMRVVLFLKNNFAVEGDSF